MDKSYFECVNIIERLHRHFLDVLKVEIDRAGLMDINNVQSLILFNIGKDELTVGELTMRGYYLGSNVSYNVKKLVENNYLIQERSIHDRRSVRVKLSDKGLKFCATLEHIFQAHVKKLEKQGFASEDFRKIFELMRRLEQFWTSEIGYGGTSPAAFKDSAA